jgi:hypothetical protein
LVFFRSIPILVIQKTDFLWENYRITSLLPAGWGIFPVNPAGQRAILLSRHPDIISSFSFNRKTLFDSVIRQPVSVSMDKSTGVARVEIPSLQPAVNFFPHPFYAHFRMILTATAVSDQALKDVTKKDYAEVNPLLPTYRAIYTDWVQSNMAQPEAGYQLSPFNEQLPGEDMVLIFAMGIPYGALSADGSIQPAPYTGDAKIMMVV